MRFARFASLALVVVLAFVQGCATTPVGSTTQPAQPSITDIENGVITGAQFGLDDLQATVAILQATGKIKSADAVKINQGITFAQSLLTTLQQHVGDTAFNTFQAEYQTALQNANLLLSNAQAKASATTLPTQ